MRMQRGRARRNSWSTRLAHLRALAIQREYVDVPHSDRRALAAGYGGNPAERLHECRTVRYRRRLLLGLPESKHHPVTRVAVFEVDRTHEARLLFECWDQM